MGNKPKRIPLTREEKLERKRIYNKNNKDQTANSNLQRLYDITLETKNRMIQSQDNRCMICGSKFKNGKDIHVDHDHNSKKVRDILCSNCNKGLGHFKENILLFEKAIKYLKKWQ